MAQLRPISTFNSHAAKASVLLLASALLGFSLSSSANPYLANWIRSTNTPMMVQHRSSFATASTLALAFSSNVKAGNTIVVCAGTQNTAGTTTISDNKGNSYSLAGFYTSGGPSVATYCFYALNAAAGATTVTLSGGNSFIVMMIAEISGVAAFDTIGMTSAASGSVTTVSTPGVVSNSTEYVLLYAHDWTNYSTWTAPAGYTIKELADQNGSTGTYIAALAEKNVKTGLSGKLTAGFTKTQTSDWWNGAILTFTTTAFAPPALVQSKSNTTSSSPLNVTFTSPVQAGNLIIACGNTDIGATGITITDNQSNTWNGTPLSNGNMRCWYAPYATAGSTTITVTTTGTTSFIDVSIFEVSGHVEVLDDSNYGSQSGTTLTLGSSLSSTTEYMLTYAVVWTHGYDTWIANGTYVIRELNELNAGQYATVAADNSVTTGLAASQSMTYTTGVANNANGYIVTFKRP